MNDFPSSDGPHGGGQPPPDGFPQHPADPYAPQVPGHEYGYAPPATAGWDQAGVAGGGYPRDGYPQVDGGYPQPGHPQGGYAPPGRPAGGYPQGDAPYPGYQQAGHPEPGHPHSGHPQQPAAPGYGQVADGYGHASDGYGHASYGEGAAYVPEPLAGQMPAEAEPGAGYGVPAAGGAWGGPAAAGPGYGAPHAAEGWAAAPAPAPAWGGAPGTAAGPDAAAAGHGWAEPAPGHGRHAAAQAVPAEPVLERTATLPVVPAEEAGSAAPRRTGSPIIPPGIQPAALTAALGLLIAGAAAVGRPGLAVVLVVLEAVTAAGWFRLNGMWPARQGIALAFLSGVTADVAVMAVDGGHGPVALLGTLGVWLLLVLVLQLRHHGSADERLSSLTATSASTLLTVVAAGYLVTATSHAGSDPVVAGAVAVAAATLVRAVRLPGGEAGSVVASLAVAAATGALTGPATGFGTGPAVLLAAAAGACALIGLRVASYDWPSRFVHFTAGVALPLTAAAPVVYALGVALT